ncbi:MAG: hypothetical protein AAB551_02400, partial [Patescibacteria group bacterium]
MTSPLRPGQDDQQNLSQEQLTPEQQDRVGKLVLGEKVEELEAGEIKKVVDILKNPDGSFLDAYKQI